MKYFAIRQKKTGFFLPQSDRTVRAGHTHMEPRHPEAVPPRLFTREQDAKCALTWWLKGVHNQESWTDDGPFYETFIVGGGPTDPVKDTARDPSTMEVVAITLLPWENNNAPK